MENSWRLGEILLRVSVVHLILLFDSSRRVRTQRTLPLPGKESI